MPPHPSLIPIVHSSALAILVLLLQYYTQQPVWAPFLEYQEAYKAERAEEMEARDPTIVFLPEKALIMDDTNLEFPANSPAAFLTGPFLTTRLPKAAVVVVVTAVLRWWWLVWLERVFPARPVLKLVARREKAGEDSSQEEAVRKKVQAGWVRGSKALSRRNTFLKWMLDLTVWNLFASVLVKMVVPMSLEGMWFWSVWDKWTLLLHFCTRIFSVASLAALLMFILVPSSSLPSASRWGIVFEAAVDLAWNCFVAAFMYTIVPWLAEMEFVPKELRNLTDTELLGSTIRWGGMGGEGGEL